MSQLTDSANVLGVILLLLVFPGPQCNLNTQQAASQDSSSSSTHPEENYSLQPPSCCAAEHEPLGSSVPEGYVLTSVLPIFVFTSC